MTLKKGEYVSAGVDYTKIDSFKQIMVEVGKRTLKFPEARSIHVETGEHGCIFSYRGASTHMWCQVQEGLGNKNWIAEWMRQNDGTGKTYYKNIARDTALMAVNDLIAQGAMPVIFTNEVAAGDSEWFEDERRARDLSSGFFGICRDVRMALPAGESPSLRYLIKAEPPVKSAPSLSGCATGIIAPSDNFISGKDLRVGDRIIGVASSGLHANGISLVIRKAMELPDKFLTKLPDGYTLGEHALISTISYVCLIEELLWHKIPIHALVPGTGSGVSKIAFDKRPFTYRIHSWPRVPFLFEYMMELGVSLWDCLTTFNFGVGYYVFVSPDYVDRALKIGRGLGYVMAEIGRVEEGKRKVIFEPKNIVLPPPGE